MSLCWLLCLPVLQGNVFTFLQQSGGRLPESVVVPMILEPTMSALHYIHGLVRLAVLLVLLPAWAPASSCTVQAAAIHLAWPC